MSYQGWDVHAYTRQCIEYIQNECYDTFFKSIDEYSMRICFQELFTFYQQNPKVLVALQKMFKRHRIGGYTDPDLLGLNISLLLYTTWQLVKSKNDTATFKGFQEILEDIGDTCIQGDSHRLLMYYAALSRE